MSNLSAEEMTAHNGRCEPSLEPVGLDGKYVYVCADDGHDITQDELLDFVDSFLAIVEARDWQTTGAWRLVAGRDE